MDQVNARVLYLMDQKSISKSQLARVLDVSPSIISHIASGRNKVGLEVIQKLVTAFPDVSASWLITGAGSMYGNENEARWRELEDEFQLLNAQVREIESGMTVLRRRLTDMAKHFTS